MQSNMQRGVSFGVTLAPWRQLPPPITFDRSSDIASMTSAAIKTQNGALTRTLRDSNSLEGMPSRLALEGEMPSRTDRGDPAVSATSTSAPGLKYVEQIA